MNENCYESGAGIHRDGRFFDEYNANINGTNIVRIEKEKYPHWVATVLGYIFGFLGGWWGFLVGGYLLTRESEKAKRHGKIIVVLTLAMITFWVFLLYV